MLLPVSSLFLKMMLSRYLTEFHICSSFSQCPPLLPLNASFIFSCCTLPSLLLISTLIVTSRAEYSISLKSQSSLLSLHLMAQDSGHHCATAHSCGVGEQEFSSRILILRSVGYILTGSSSPWQRVGVYMDSVIEMHFIRMTWHVQCSMQMSQRRTNIA